MVNEIRQYFFSLAFDRPPGQNIIKRPTIKLYKKINKPILNKNMFYVEEDKNKKVFFNGETSTFTILSI